MLRTAIKFIFYDKPKSFGALAGVIISIFLIGQNVGIFSFLTNAMASIVTANKQYIWVVDGKTTNVNALAAVDMRVGRELGSFPGVKKVAPVVITIGAAKFVNGKASSVTLVGSQAPDFIGGPWNLFQGTKEDMLREGAIVTDYFDRKALGDALIGEYFELNGKKVFIAANTKGVRGFGGPVYTFTTIERARYITNMPNTKASAFLVEYDPAYKKEDVINAINARLHGVKAWDSEEFAASSITTVLKSSGIAISFGTIIVFAFISGLVIIGLTLYSAAIDRIKDYGTLKAIGATNGYIVRLIMTQAGLFGLTGFIIGSGLLELFRMGIANAGTLFTYSLTVRLVFFAVTMFISLGGSLFAIKRITSLEPAQVFRT